jgi:hypothetical protein
VKFSELTPVDELWKDLPPVLCERCGALIQDWSDGDPFEFVYVKECKSGECMWFYCRVCDFPQSSFGPITCPYCGSWPRRLPSVRRMRHLYRVKRRHW